MRQGTSFPRTQGHGGTKECAIGTGRKRSPLRLAIIIEEKPERNWMTAEFEFEGSEDNCFKSTELAPRTV